MRGWEEIHIGRSLPCPWAKKEVDVNGPIEWVLIKVCIHKAFLQYPKEESCVCKRQQICFMLFRKCVLEGPPTRNDELIKDHYRKYLDGTQVLSNNQ